MSGTDGSIFGKFSLKNPMARIVYSSAPILCAAGVEIAILANDPTPQTAILSTLAAAGIVLAPAASVAGNVLAEAISQKFFNRFSRRDILENGDLQKAVGDAVSAAALMLHDENKGIFRQQEKGFAEKVKHIFLEKIVIENKGAMLNQLVLERIANVPQTAWPKLIEALETAKDEELNPSKAEIEKLYPKNLPGIFAIRAAEFNALAVLNPKTWGKILRKLCQIQGIGDGADKFPHFDATILRTAEVLYQNFPELLKDTLVTNISRDGKAYADLQLKIIGEILGCVRENGEQIGKANDKLIEIETNITKLRESLENRFSASSTDFDHELAKLENLIRDNQQIIIDGINDLKKDTEILKTGNEILLIGQENTREQLNTITDTAETLVIGTEILLQGQDKIQEGINEFREILPHIEISQKELFEGFHLSFPRVHGFFTGRVKVLEQLEKTLKTENQAAFFGTHGLGKTRTAIEYALRNRKRFKYILFISATKGNFTSSAAFAGGEISPEIEKAQTLDEKYEKFLKHLQKYPGWLLIIDNVEDAGEVTGKIPKHFDGKVIYTSNLRAISDAATIVPLEAMPPGEAELTILRRKTGDNASKLADIPAEERNALTCIVEKIGALPIGLTLAGAYINKYVITFRRYLTFYETFEAEIFKNFDLADYYGEEFLKGLTKTEKAEYKGIAGVFLLSYKRITTPKDDTPRENLLTETIKAILNLSVFLAPEKVPEELWLEGLKQIDEKLAKASEDILFWLAVNERLTQAAFFLRNADENTSTTHRLILYILQNQLKDTEKRRFAEIAIDVIDDLWTSSKFEYWKTCNQLLRHAETALQSAEKLSIVTQNAGRLCNQIAYYVDDLGEYEKAVLFYQQALSIGEKTIGKDHPGYATRLNNLANVYQLQGKYDEAVKLFNQALAIDERTIGKDHPNYAKGLSNLAIVYQSQGKYDEAIELYKQAMLIDEKTIGKNHPDYAIDLNNLANVYQSQGKYDEAVELYKQALSIGEKTIGKDHPNYAIRLSNLAIVYRAQGKYDEAVELYKQALLIGEQTIGKDHPEYATRLNNLANVYESQGKYDEAVELFKQVLSIDEKTIGKDHPEHAIHLNNLASVYLSQGKYDEAVELLQQALSIDEKTIGKDHPDYAIRLSNLAGVYESQGKYDEALKLYREALRIDLQTLPENHPYTQQDRESVERCRRLAGEK
jgi:tetratricopeptide (TPR) repeat protein